MTGYVLPAPLTLHYGEAEFPLTFEVQPKDEGFRLLATLKARGIAFGCAFQIPADAQDFEIDRVEKEAVQAAAMRLAMGRQEQQVTPAHQEAFHHIMARVNLVDGRLPR